RPAADFRAQPGLTLTSAQWTPGGGRPGGSEAQGNEALPALAFRAHGAGRCEQTADGQEKNLQVYGPAVRHARRLSDILRAVWAAAACSNLTLGDGFSGTVPAQNPSSRPHRPHPP